MTLHQLPLGKAAVVLTVNGEGIEKQRMLDMGLVPGTIVQALRRGPSGDPTAYYVRGATIALRSDLTDYVTVNCKE